MCICHAVPQTYYELLRKEDPIAMALYARILAIVSLLEEFGSWWVHGVGNNKMPRKNVQSVLTRMPLELRWTMEWPMRILGLGAVADSLSSSLNSRNTSVSTETW